MNNKELIDKYEDKLKDVQFKFGDNFKTKVYEELLDDLKQLDEPEPIKLRDVIARIKQLDIGTRKVWLDEFLNELGSDYGALKYKAGYEQGKFEASTIPYEEPQKVQVSEEEAKFLETFDFNCESDVTTALYHVSRTGWGYYLRDNNGIDLKDLSEGLGELENRKRLIKAILDGHEVEKEKRYLVKAKGMDADFVVLKLDKIKDSWYLGNDTEYSYTKAKHTRKELEDAGFGWVFDCEGIEIKEVEG